MAETAKIRVVVMYGGKADEHSISCISTAGVLRALDTDRFEPVPVGITKQGQWIVDGEDPRGWDMADGLPVVEKTPGSRDVVLDVVLGQDGFFARNDDGTLSSLGHVDAVLPVLHGPYGEDGTIQGLLEMMDVPYVGCGVLASAACMDKHYTKVLLAAAGIPVAPGITVDARGFDAASRFAADADGLLARVEEAGLAYPLFVKPACAGSSFGVTRVETPDALPAAVAEAFRHDGKVLVEQAVPGFEVGCAVLGAGEALTVGEVDEIELAHGFFDYTEKYTLETARIHMPARLSLAERDRVREAAKTVYRALCCTGFARVDLFYTPDGRIVFNEVNTIPGFTEHSRFPGMMRGAGVEFGPLVERLLEQAVADV